VFWVISVYFNIRNTLPKYGRFLLGHPVYDIRPTDPDLYVHISDIRPLKVKLDLREIGWDVVAWIDMAQDRD
jgi:hypothetical protein